MKHLFTAAALCLGMLGAQAQSDNGISKTGPAHNCLLNTTDKDWSALGLTADQSAKVKDIQAECMKMNDRSKADNMDSKESPMMNKYEDKVKAVLTPEQYDKWIKWCSTHAANTVGDDNTMEKD